MHRVRAVADHDAGYACADLLADALGQRNVLLRAHVLAEDAEQLLRAQIADLGQLRPRAIELAGGEGWDDGAGAIVQSAGDRTACTEQNDVWLVGVEREL